MRGLVFVISIAMMNSVYAGDLTIPNTFVGGTPARAAEVNDNFTAVEAAVDDNDARTTTPENSQTVQNADIGNLEVGQQALQANDATQDTRLDTLEAADLINRITALENALAAHIADLTNPHAVTKAQIGLSNVEDIRVNYTAIVPPTVNDDINSGYSVGSVWIDVAQDQAYVSVDSTSGVAVWKSITTKYYQIGDTGPAGGIVFYITDGGAHGFEAAPVDLPRAQWGCSPTGVPDTGIGIGTGAANTAKIVAICADPTSAAQLADTYSLNSYSDWFLPSRD